MEVSVLVALLTLLGSCCVGLVLLVILIVVVVLVLTGRVKKAEPTAETEDVAGRDIARAPLPDKGGTDIVED